MMSSSESESIGNLRHVSLEFRWASEVGSNGMPYPEELEYFGYIKVRRSPLYHASWLMRREIS